MKHRIVRARYTIVDCEFYYTYTRKIPPKRLNPMGYWLCLNSQHKATQRILDSYYYNKTPCVGDQIANDVVASKLEVIEVNFNYELTDLEKKYESINNYIEEKKKLNDTDKNKRQIQKKISK